jgi:hypothetical protein
MLLYSPALAEDEASLFSSPQRSAALAKSDRVERVAAPTKGYKNLHKIIGHTLGSYTGWLWWRYIE